MDEATLKKLFDSLDVDKNNCLSLTELKEAVLGDDVEGMEAFFSACDTDGDRKVSFTEFKAFFNIKNIQTKLSSLRTQYSKTLDQPRTGSGGCKRTERQLWLLNTLSFLKKYITWRKGRTSSLHGSQSQPQSQHSQESQEVASQNDEGEESQESVEDDRQSRPSIRKSPRLRASPSPGTHDDVTVVPDSQGDPCENAGECSGTQSTSRNMKKAKMTNRRPSPEPSPVSKHHRVTADNVDGDTSGETGPTIVVNQEVFVGDDPDGDMDNVADAPASSKASPSTSRSKGKGSGKSSQKAKAKKNNIRHTLIEDNPMPGAPQSIKQRKRLPKTDDQERELYSGIQQSLAKLAEPEEVVCLTDNQVFCEGLCRKLDTFTDARQLTMVKEKLNRVIFDAQMVQEDILDGITTKKAASAAMMQQLIPPMQQHNQQNAHNHQNPQNQQFQQGGGWANYGNQYPAQENEPNIGNYIRML